MRIRDVLQRKGTEVFTARVEEPVSQVVDSLNQRRIGALVVVGEDGRVAGIITERDILRHYGQCAAAPPDKPVRVADIMTTELVIGLPEDEIQYVMGVMTHERIRHLPVLDSGELVGLISIGDVVKALMAEVEFENRMLKDYIQGG